MKLEGKTALVTGGSSGIGEAIAVRFAAEGARVAVVGSSDLAKAQQVVAKIEAAGGAAQAFVADVREVDAVKALVGAVKDAFGRIDILVNSAGIFEPTPIGETSGGRVRRHHGHQREGHLLRHQRGGAGHDRARRR